MAPRTSQQLQERAPDQLVREPPNSGPLSLAPVSLKSSKKYRKRMFVELFADTGAKERRPELGGSLTKPSKGLSWVGETAPS